MLFFLERLTTRAPNLCAESPACHFSLESASAGFMELVGRAVLGEHFRRELLDVASDRLPPSVQKGLNHPDIESTFHRVHLLDDERHARSNGLRSIGAWGNIPAQTPEKKS